MMLNRFWVSSFGRMHKQIYRFVMLNKFWVSSFGRMHKQIYRLVMLNKFWVSSFWKNAQTDLQICDVKQVLGVQFLEECTNRSTDL